MAKLPPRDAKGRFVSRKKKNPRKKKSSRSSRNLPPRDRFGRFVSRSGSRRSRRNPPMRGMGGAMRRVGGAAVEAAQLTVGKAASRAVPDLVGLPSAGNIGLLIRGGTAVAIGVVADVAGQGELGYTLMAGGLQGALEDALVGYNVPFLADALRRAPGLAGGGSVGRYVASRTTPTGHRLRAADGGKVARYVAKRSAPAPDRGVMAMSKRGY